MKTLFALLALCLPVTTFATDQNRPVLDVIIVDVAGDLEGFLERMARVQAVAKRLELPAKLRVFQGTFAGEQNGEIFLYWELPSFIAFAEAETKLHDDPEFLAILAEMQAAGQDFKSESLSIEITKR
ncbi:MAG: hypothetical protein ACE5KS_10020 [Woeseiaceae bacterium]